MLRPSTGNSFTTVFALLHQPLPPDDTTDTKDAGPLTVVVGLTLDVPFRCPSCRAPLGEWPAVRGGTALCPLDDTVDTLSSPGLLITTITRVRHPILRRVTMLLRRMLVASTVKVSAPAPQQPPQIGRNALIRPVPSMQQSHLDAQPSTERAQLMALSA